MRDIIERAWRTAAECAVQADETTDVEIKEFFIKRRNAWIDAANRLELLGFTDADPTAIEREHSETHPAAHHEGFTPMAGGNPH